MKRLFERTIQVESKEVTRTIIENHGVATARLNNERKEVVPVSGAPLDKSTKWRVK